MVLYLKYKKYFKKLIVGVCSAVLAVTWPILQLVGVDRVRKYIALLYKDRSRTSWRLTKPLVFVAIPKSASKTITSTLANILETRQQLIAVKIRGSKWPLNTKLSRGRLLLSIVVGAVGHEHLCANKRTLQAISLLTDEIYVHIRDPRQVIVSMTEHFIENRDRFDDFGVDGRQFDAHVAENNYDYMIKQFFPIILQWLDEWRKCKELNQYGLRVTFVSYEEFLLRQIKYFGQILESVSTRIDCDNIHVSESKHYRKGEMDEWKLRFNEIQIKTMNDMIGQDTKEYFGWN